MTSKNSCSAAHPSRLRATLAAAALALAGVSAQAGVLIGSATLLTADDLTRVQVGGNVLEFLDLSATNGLSWTAALSTYGSYGFTVAFAAAVSELFDAFGFAFLSTGSVSILAATGAQSASFDAYLGETTGQGSQGSYIDDVYGNGYFCISTGGCGPTNFTYTVDRSAGQPNIGVTLVRNGSRANAVPEPGSLALIGLAGLAAFAASRRRAVGKADPV